LLGVMGGCGERKGKGERGGVGVCGFWCVGGGGGGLGGGGGGGGGG